MSVSSLFMPLLSSMIVLTQLNAQEVTYPQGYFESPMKVPLEVSGTFCELRSNHFHFGMDFRTDGREGLEMYSCAEGYVWRIKVSYFGYGKAIYIKHPNGYITLYGHLKEYGPGIKALVNARQILEQNFEIDYYPAPGEIPIEKGQLIAYSGNTGSSQGGHLHFEIRDSTGEISINPLLFGLKVVDTQKPVFTSISVYSLLDGAGIRVDNPVAQGKSGPYLTNGNVFTASGRVGIAFQAYDKQNATNYKNNLFSAEMQVNGLRKFYVEFDKIAFHESRYINAYLDYKEKLKSNLNIQRCFILPNNLLENYDGLLGNGTWIAVKDSVYKVKIILKDVAGNASEMEFSVKGGNTVETFTTTGITETEVADGTEDITITRDFGSVFFPKNSLYDKLKVVFEKGNTTNIYGYPEYTLNDWNIPIHQNIKVRFKLLETNPVEISKLGIVYINGKGKKRFYGGEIKDGFLECETNDLGIYTIMADTTRPVITTALKDSATLLANGRVKFTVTDDFSGIAKYDIWVDGNWILAEYEWKNNEIKTEPVALSAGWHAWKIRVTDKRGNVAERNFTFKSP